MMEFAPHMKLKIANETVMSDGGSHFASVEHPLIIEEYIKRHIMDAFCPVAPNDQLAMIEAGNIFVEELL